MRSTLELSRSYFNVCDDLHRARYWNTKDRALLGLKIFSFFTIIIPIVVSIMYATSKHFHNVKVIREGETLVSSLNGNSYIYSRLMVSDVKKVCSAVKKQFQKGHKAESQRLLTQIKFHTDRKTALIMEHLNSLMLIAKAQLKTNSVDDALITVRSILDQIPELRETSPEVIKYQNLAKILIPVDPELAQTALDRATNRIDGYEAGIIHRRGEMNSYERGCISRWRDEINELRAQLVRA